MDTDDLPEVNDMLGYVKFCLQAVFWSLSTVETLIEQLHEAWYVHSCLFHVKTKRKEEGITLRAAVRTRGVYTAICHASSKSAKTAFIVWISWKKIIICSVQTEQISTDQYSTEPRTEPKDLYWKFSVWIRVPLHP